MRFDREPWRKLYRSESVEDRLLPVVVRGLRDYLLRHAADDGTLIAKTEAPGEDMARAIGAHPDEFTVTVGGVERLIASGYLKHKNGRLWIAKFQEAQQTRSANAARQKRFRERHKTPTVTQRERNDSVTSNATDNATVTVEEKRREEKRDPPLPPNPAFSSARKCEATFTTAPGSRSDVQEIHAAWKASVSWPEARFRNQWDDDAKRIADAIDSHGLDACRTVAKHCGLDGMVSGKKDERGEKHRTIRYIFENNDTFTRILHDGQAREGRDGKRRPASELVREALSR